MDEEFVRRWRHSLPPFDGATLSLPDLLPLSRLQPILQSVVEILQRRYGNLELYTLHDWHEHDGWVSPSMPSRWDELMWVVSSRYALRGACTGDTYVSTGFFPESRAFYLRIYIPDEPDQPAPTSEWTGEFDITCAESEAHEIEPLVHRQCGVTLLREPASQFFNRGWSG